MTHTSQDYIEALYDRKTSRHKWQLLVSTTDYQHMNHVAERYQNMVQGKAGWEQYEQRMFTFDTSITHQYPDSLPCNYKEQG